MHHHNASSANISVEWRIIYGHGSSNTAVVQEPDTDRDGSRSPVHVDKAKVRAMELGVLVSAIPFDMHVRVERDAGE